MLVCNMNTRKLYFLCICSCQFIVNAEGDYATYLSNPDALVDWDLVEQIVRFLPLFIISYQFFNSLKIL